MRTKEDALMEVKSQLVEAERRIAEYPERFIQWVSQSYGYVMGIGYAYPELDKELMTIWSEWRSKAYNQRYASK